MNHDELLRELDEQPNDTGLRDCAAAIRSLQADLDTAKSAARLTVAQVDAHVMERLAKAEAELARVTEERDAAKLALAHGEALCIERENRLRTQLAALAPRAEAMDALEKWLGSANERTAELTWYGPAVIAGQECKAMFIAEVAGGDNEPHGSASADDLASAIRAAFERASLSSPQKPEKR